MLEHEKQTLKRSLQEAGDAYAFFEDATKLQSKIKKLLDRAARNVNIAEGNLLQALFNRMRTDFALSSQCFPSSCNPS